ncbi:MAG: hypothetical protein HZB15_00040 [Actinobacteria bacterium]|nr:hypothetical protein [Actinomycetota bacterium]
MSWLFDRLCALAGADRVDVIVAADVSESIRSGADCDLVDVLVRASTVPQLTVWLLPTVTHRQISLELSESVDLDLLSADGARTAVERLLLTQSRLRDGVLQVEARTISLGPGDRAARALHDIMAHEPGDTGHLFATDHPQYEEVFGHLERCGLGVAIGGVDPRAAVSVPDSAGAVAIVDALVLLRSFAFGMSSADASLSGLARTGSLV